MVAESGRGGGEVPDADRKLLWSFAGVKPVDILFEF